MPGTENEMVTETSVVGTRMASALKNRIHLYKKLIRTHELTGVWLTLWPSVWSITLAAKDTSIPLLDLVYCLLLMVAFSFLLLSISNIYNDIIDRDFDRQVERCKDRPLATGAVSVGEALALISPFLLLCALLMMQMNEKGKIILLGSLGLLFVYPFAKRFTNYPAVVLGLTANNGIFLGWTLVRGDIEWSICAPLLVGAFFWTIVYDTMYGLQDAADDTRIGVKSMALSFGSRLRFLTAAASALAMLCFTVVGLIAGLTWPYYVAVVVVLVHLFTQVSRVNIDDPKDCGAKYRSNQTLALILFLGIVADRYYCLASSDTNNRKMWSDNL